MSTTVTREEFSLAVRTATLPKDLKFFENMVLQLKRYLQTRAAGWPTISSETAYLFILQVYVQIICPFPDGDNSFFNYEFGRLVKTLFSTSHPQFTKEILQIWIDSKRISQGFEHTSVH